MGEALSQAQRVAADRDALTSLLTGTVDRPGMDLAAISRMFSRLVANHTRGWPASASRPELPALLRDCERRSAARVRLATA